MGRVVSVATVIATDVNADGYQEILGFDVFTIEDGPGWTAFLRGLVARELSGVALVVSDAHEGLRNAIPPRFRTPPGSAGAPTSWPVTENLLTRVPKAAQAMVATLVRTAGIRSPTRSR